jgi:glycosyltransferase involved in cell wall biosynthesis
MTTAKLVEETAESISVHSSANHRANVAAAPAERAPSVRRWAVLHIANYPDRVGGGEESLLGLVQGLHRQGYRVQVLVPGEGDLVPAVRRLRVPLTIQRFPSVRPWALRPMVRAVRALRRFVQETGIELIHAHGSRGALYAGLAMRGRSVPLVWHVRVARRDPWLDPLLTRLATAIVANSRATAERFDGCSRSSGKVQVVHNGVDLDRFSEVAGGSVDRRRLGVSEGAKLVTYVGRVEEAKGVDLLLQAAELVSRSVADVRFLIVGDGPQRPPLEAWCRRRSLPVTFFGRRSDVPEFLSLCEAVVLPSRHEGFGRILIEAMAAGVPVVATAVGGVPEVCESGKTGLLVPPEDPAALAEAIIDTLTNETATQTRAAQAKAEVRARFSLDQHVASIMRLYDSLLGR